MSFEEPLTLPSQLLARKSIDKLIRESEEPEHGLKKTLGPWSLTALGIGAVIGSGIFTVIGTAISGEQLPSPTITDTPLIHYIITHTTLAGRPGAGPAIALSMVLVAFVCALTGLCYAELASMIPIAGSAYTYTYATLGELIAWIIGWDLILEYAGSNMSVSVGFAAHVVDLLDWFGLHPGTRWISPAYLPDGLQDLAGNNLYNPGWHFGFNIPAFLIVMLLTVILVRGIRESASTNNVMVGFKLIAILIFVFAAIGFIHPGNWHPFMPNGWSGVLTGGSIIFFTYIGFDSVSTAAEECRNPQRDLPIGIIATLVVCTVLYVAVAVCLTGLVPWHSMVGDAAPVVNALKKLSVLPGGHPLVLDPARGPARRPHGHDLLHPRLPDRPVARLVLHVPRRPAAQSLLQRPSPLSHASFFHLGRRHRRRHSFRPFRHRHSRRPFQYRHPLRLRPCLHRSHRPAHPRSQTPSRLRRSRRRRHPRTQRHLLLPAHGRDCPLSPGTASSSGWSSAWFIYFLYSRHRSEFAQPR